MPPGPAEGRPKDNSAFSPGPMNTKRSRSWAPDFASRVRGWVERCVRTSNPSGTLESIGYGVAAESTIRVARLPLWSCDFQIRHTSKRTIFRQSHTPALRPHPSRLRNPPFTRLRSAGARRRRLRAPDRRLARPILPLRCARADRGSGRPRRRSLGSRPRSGRSGKRQVR